MFHVFFEYFGYMDNLKRVMESIVVVEYGDRHGGTCKIPMRRKLSRITYNGKRLTYYQVAFLIKHGYIPEETSHWRNKKYLPAFRTLILHIVC